MSTVLPILLLLLLLHGGILEALTVYPVNVPPDVSLQLKPAVAFSSTAQVQALKPTGGGSASTRWLFVRLPSYDLRPVKVGDTLLQAGDIVLYVNRAHEGAVRRHLAVVNFGLLALDRLPFATFIVHTGQVSARDYAQGKQWRLLDNPQFPTDRDEAEGAVVFKAFDPHRIAKDSLLGEVARRIAQWELCVLNLTEPASECIVQRRQNLAFLDSYFRGEPLLVFAAYFSANTSFTDVLPTWLQASPMTRSLVPQVFASLDGPLRHVLLMRMWLYAHSPCNATLFPSKHYCDGPYDGSDGRSCHAHSYDHKMDNGYIEDNVKIVDQEQECHWTYWRFVDALRPATGSRAHWADVAAWMLPLASRFGFRFGDFINRLQDLLADHVSPDYRQLSEANLDIVFATQLHFDLDLDMGVRNQGRLPSRPTEDDVRGVYPRIVRVFRADSSSPARIAAQEFVIQLIAGYEHMDRASGVALFNHAMDRHSRLHGIARLVLRNLPPEYLTHVRFAAMCNVEYAALDDELAQLFRPREPVSHLPRDREVDRDLLMQASINATLRQVAQHVISPAEDPNAGKKFGRVIGYPIMSAMVQSSDTVLCSGLSSWFLASQVPMPPAWSEVIDVDNTVKCFQAYVNDPVVGKRTHWLQMLYDTKEVLSPPVVQSLDLTKWTLTNEKPALPIGLGSTSLARLFIVDGFGERYNPTTQSTERVNLTHVLRYLAQSVQIKPSLSSYDKIQLLMLAMEHVLQTPKLPLMFFLQD
jgi:hypothetical protein